MKLPEYRPGNRIVCGSTRSGKTTARVIDIVADAPAKRDCKLIRLTGLADDERPGLTRAKQKYFQRLSDAAR